jgi:hypothetical protein
MPEDKLNQFLQRLNEETGEESENERKSVTVSAQQANVDQTTWRRVPNSAKSLYYWYRQNIPSEDRDKHGFFEFLDDMVGYLMSFSMMSNMNKAGKLIADYDLGRTGGDEEAEGEGQEEE